MTREARYSSGAASGPGVPFPPGARIEFFHGLGGTPALQLAYVAYSSCPTEQPCDAGAPNGSGFTLASGDAAVFQDVNSESVIVKNTTCADFFLRVELRDPEQQ